MHSQISSKAQQKQQQAKQAIKASVKRDKQEALVRRVEGYR
jgi:hypothetical protein